MIRKFSQFFMLATILFAAACSSNQDQVTADESLSSAGDVAATDSVPAEAVTESSAPTTVASTTPDSSNLGASSSGYGH